MSIVLLSEVKKLHLYGRIDAEHYRKEFLENVKLIKRFPGGYTSLGQELVEMTGGATPLGADYPETGVRFLRVQNIMPNYIDDADMTYISAADDMALARSRLRLNDVLLTITGVSYGKSATVTPEYVGSNINQHSVRMQFRRGKFRPVFVSTFLNSKPGKRQSDQSIVGVTRPALDYSTIRSFIIPQVSDALQKAVEHTVALAQVAFHSSRNFVADAEQILLHALGLDTWQPPEPLTYTRRASNVFAAGRMDAEHYQPRFDAMLGHIKSRGAQVHQLGDLIYPVKNGYDFRYFVAEGTPYIRVGDISQARIDLDGAMRIPVTVDEVGKNIRLQVGDILFTRKGSFGNAAPVRTGEEHSIISSEIMLLRLKPDWRAKLVPEFVVCFLNSIAGAYQAERAAHGVAFYSVSQNDLGSFHIPIPAMELQVSIQAKLNSAEQARRYAHALLARAQRAVEIAIEQSEAAALAYLNAAEL